MKKNICSVCGTVLKEEKITYSQAIGNKFYIVKNVTAQVCHQCGEEYLSPDTVDAIQELIEGKKTPPKIQEVPVYYLS